MGPGLDCFDDSLNRVAARNKIVDNNVNGTLEVSFYGKTGMSVVFGLSHKDQPFVQYIGEGGSDEGSALASIREGVERQSAKARRQNVNDLPLIQERSVEMSGYHFGPSHFVSFPRA